MRTFVIEYYILGRTQVEIIRNKSSVMAIKTVQSKYKRSIRVLSIKLSNVI